MGAEDSEIQAYLKTPPRVHINHVNNYRQSALYLATLTNRCPSLVHQMVTLGADPMCHDSRGDSPFHIVCRLVKVHCTLYNVQCTLYNAYSYTVCVLSYIFLCLPIYIYIYLCTTNCTSIHFYILRFIYVQCKIVKYSN